MTKKTETVGHDGGAKSSDDILSPSKPYTGDGVTTRHPHDPVQLDRPARDPGK